MAAPKKIDYERIEPGWRAGIKSPAQLAAEYTEDTGVSVSHAAIIKHFTKRHIPRDLSAKVRAKADSMVMEAMVTGKVSPVTIKRETEIVDESATIVANVRVSHRSDIRRYRSLCNTILSELEHQTEHLDLYHELADVLEAKDKDGNPTGTDKLNEIYRRVIGMPQRVDSLKKLAETLKVLIGLEREAYNIAASADDPASRAKEGEPLSAQDAYMAMLGK